MKLQTCIHCLTPDKRPCQGLSPAGCEEDPDSGPNPGTISLTAPAPAPIIGSPVSAGSYLQSGLPNSGVAQGSTFIIFSKMTIISGVFYASSFPLPTTLNSTSVSITVGSTTVAAIMSYVSFGQLAAILPSGTPLGTGTVTVSSGGQKSNAAAITVVSNAFGALAYNASGTGPAVIFNNSQSGQPVNNLLTAAAPGEVAELWGTGLGPITGSDAQPPAQSNQYGSQTTVVVRRHSRVLSAGLISAGRSTFAGIDQINFVVPSGVSGCWVPVYVVINNIPSNVTSMAIAPSDGPCTDPTQISSADISTFQSGKSNLNVGLMGASRFTVNLNLVALGGAASGVHDQFQAQFAQIAKSDLAFNPVLILPYCAFPRLPDRRAISVRRKRSRQHRRQQRELPVQFQPNRCRNNHDLFRGCGYRSGSREPGRIGTV